MHWLRTTSVHSENVRSKGQCSTESEFWHQWQSTFDFLNHSLRSVQAHHSEAFFPLKNARCSRHQWHLLCPNDRLSIKASVASILPQRPAFHPQTWPFCSNPGRSGRPPRQCEHHRKQTQGGWHVHLEGLPTMRLQIGSPHTFGRSTEWPFGAASFQILTIFGSGFHHIL